MLCCVNSKYYWNVQTGCEEMCLVDSSVHFRLILVGCKLLLSRASVGLYIFVVNWILWSTDWSGTCRRNALQPILSRCTDWHGSGVVRRSGWIWGWYVLLMLLSSFFSVIAYFIVSISPSSLVGQQKDVKLQVFLLVVLVCILSSFTFYVMWQRDGVGNTAEENTSVFCLMWIHWSLLASVCEQ